MLTFRHTLHTLAEPSGEEVRTQAFLLEQLRPLNPTKIHTFENSRNILVLFDSGVPGSTQLLRGDFDALHVPETIDVPYASQTAGVSHKCGHDGHAAILLGVAQLLHTNPPKEGRVLLFFQAAEETGDGVRQLLETGILEQYRPDEVFAFHNIPGVPLGQVLCRAGSFTCSVVSCDIVLTGHTAHAAEPLKALSPYPAARAITDRLLALNRYEMSAPDFQLLTLVQFRVGEVAYGVAAGEGVLRFTLRAKEDARLQALKRELVRIVEEEVAKCTGLQYDMAWKEYFAASENHPDAVEKVQQAAEQCGLAYVTKEQPFSWGEDFGLLTQHFDGALFGIGSGTEQPPLHHPHFDFPDELLPIGVKMFQALLHLSEK
ncbi:MAG: amidohydrolase [Bacteroidales bacterium]|nr:amidohydrolase [Bacteroidales bacterium]